jgi:hypothetical protein
MFHGQYAFFTRAVRETSKGDTKQTRVKKAELFSIFNFPLFSPGTLLSKPLFTLFLLCHSLSPSFVISEENLFNNIIEYFQ